MKEVEYQPRMEKIPIYAEADILVIGGGVAGIGAALAAARNKKKVAIIEKSCVLGGLATLGHVCVYLSLDDGMGNKVFGGIAEELLYTTIKYGYNNLAKGWEMGVMRLESPEGRYKSHFNIPACILAFDELMKDEGIDVVFDAVFSEPIMEGNVCTGVILETKQGRVAYMAKMIVDASGDADVLYRAGASCVEQNSIVSHWCYELELEQMKKGLEKGDVLSSINLRWLGLRPDVDNSQSPLTKFPGTSIDGVNGYLSLSRELALDFLKKNQRPDYAMMTLPFMPQFRMTRRVEGIKELDLSAPDAYLEDSVGCVCYSIAVSAPVYEFPYGAILDKKLKNIAAAGRIVAAAGAGWEMMRLIPACVFTGQVAGTAAALAIDAGVSLQEVNIKALQSNLESAGVILHVPDYMKGNIHNHTVKDPKQVADDLIKAEALHY